MAKSQPFLVNKFPSFLLRSMGKAFFLLKGWEFECKIQLGLGGLHIQYPNLKKEVDHWRNEGSNH